MKREKFIQELTTNLSPVKRIYPEWVSFLLWVLFSVFFVGLFIWTKSLYFSELHFPDSYLDPILILGVILSSSYIVIYSSVPGNRVRGKYVFVPLFFLLMWIFHILFKFLWFENAVSPNQSYHGCAKDILLMSIPPAATLIYLLNKLVPTHKIWLGFYTILASSSLGALGISFLCSNESPDHLFLFHILPLLVAGVLGIFLGKILRVGEY